MAKAVRVHQVGGPEALIYESIDLPPPGAGEVHIRQHAVGLNFIDVYYRTRLYKAPSLPFIAGNEAAGEVVAVGPGVTEFHPGDRVAYYANLGGYATERNIAADKLVKLPDHITYEHRPRVGGDVDTLQLVSRLEICRLDIAHARASASTMRRPRSASMS